MNMLNDATGKKAAHPDHGRPTGQETKPNEINP